MERRETRSINMTDSSLLKNPAEESSPLLGSRYSGRSFQSSSRSHSHSGTAHYHFDLDRERKRCKKLFHNRVPKGKAPFFVFLINFLESFAFYGAINFVRFTVFNETDSDQRPDLAFTIFYFTAGRVFYPVAGLLADVYLGRYRVIHIGLWLLWVGFAIILTGMACEWRYPYLTVVQRIPAIIATILFMLGSASVESTIIPFGVDQIQQGATSDELSSYFSWYYFGRNAGYLTNVLCSIGISYLQSTINTWIHVSDITDHHGAHCNTSCARLSNKTFQQIESLDSTIPRAALGLIIVVALTTAILLLHCLHRLFFKARQRENPLRNIINVVYFAATVRRQAPRYRRSFRYGEGRKARIELAKIEFDGIYSSEEVEDVKTFFRVFFFILSLGLSFAIFGALNGKYANITTDKTKFITGDKNGFPTYFLFAETGLLLLFIPILNHFLLPCFPGASMKRRIGMGVVFLLLSAVLCTFAHWKVYESSTPGSDQIQLMWVSAPVLLFSIADMLLFVSGLEFIYAQSPDSMKGLLTGLFYFVFGIFNGVGALIFYTTLHRSMWYFYGTVLIVATSGLVIYILIVWCYRNRERPTNDESEKEILHRSYATSVYLS